MSKSPFSRCCAVLTCLLFAPGLAADVLVRGQVVDSTGQGIAGAMVIYEPVTGHGPTAQTVFSVEDGRFAFPEALALDADGPFPFTLRVLGFAPQPVSIAAGTATDGGIELRMQAREDTNLAAVAPASAWLARIEDRRELSTFIMACIDCHQVPASEQRAFAASIHEPQAPEPAAQRLQHWTAMATWMSALSRWEFSRGFRADAPLPEADAVYGVDNIPAVAQTLATYFDDALETLHDYDWGAPLISTAQTVIREYAVPEPNAVREALLLGTPAKLWVADVSANRLFAIDVDSGEHSIHEVPSDVLMSPHSLHRDNEGKLWVTPLFNGILARLDPQSGDWQTWSLRTDEGRVPGIHDLSFGWEHQLQTDADDRIWYSDIGNNAVGYFDPEDGSARIWQAPPSPGRTSNPALYGLSMNSDSSELWYSQLGNGTFGGFDLATRTFIGPFQLPDPNAGPRRIAISEDDVLYLALYGSGQLAEFDTRTREMTGIYDLPDTASAPYATTWDPVREVVWIATANGDVIYRFNPDDKSFGVLPLPRERAFLRMIDVDPATGVLVSSYANIVESVQGPRMALIIDPGDGAYSAENANTVRLVNVSPGNSVVRGK